MSCRTLPGTPDSRVPLPKWIRYSFREDGPAWDESWRFSPPTAAGATRLLPQAPSHGFLFCWVNRFPHTTRKWSPIDFAPGQGLAQLGNPALGHPGVRQFDGDELLEVDEFSQCLVGDIRASQGDR